MNTREKLLVARLMMRLAEAPAAPKDAEAELELAALLRQRGDAPYLLMQRALMLEAALEQAHLEIDRLSARVAAEPSSRPSPVAAPGAPLAAVSAPTPAASGGGFLRNAATIGAGVLGGSLLFQGIESLLHGARGIGGGLAQAPVEVFETNNFISNGDAAGGGSLLGDRGDPGDFAFADDSAGPLFDGDLLS